MVFWILKRDLIKLLKIHQLLARICGGLLEVYGNRADNLNNNLRLNEISIIIFSNFTAQ